MYHIPSARDFTPENALKKALSHPAYSFNYWPIELLIKNRPAEYKQADTYEGKLAEVKNYEQEHELDIQFRTHIPVEHPLHQQEMMEPALKEYDADVQRTLMDVETEEYFTQRLVDYLTAILESEPDNSELINDFFVNLELISETNTDDQLLNDAQNNEVELDDIMENDTIQDVSLDALIDEILGESVPDHPLEDEQLEDYAEPFMPFY